MLFFNKIFKKKVLVITFFVIIVVGSYEVFNFRQQIKNSYQRQILKKQIVDFYNEMQIKRQNYQQKIFKSPLTSLLLCSEIKNFSNDAQARALKALLYSINFIELNNEYQYLLLACNQAENKQNFDEVNKNFSQLKKNELNILKILESIIELQNNDFGKYFLFSQQNKLHKQLLTMLEKK